jgi:hypothetical protein
MDTVARFHKVRYNGRILCARVAPALAWNGEWLMNDELERIWKKSVVVA